MTITVAGAGYVGLVTAAVLSELGNKVFCLDIDKGKIENLKKGIVPFFEPGLSDYINRNVKEKRLSFTTSYKDSVTKSKIVLICVGSPPTLNGDADLTSLFSAVEETAKNIKNYTLITIKSTIPIGFEDDLEKSAKKHAKTKFEFASSPEFLKEGTAIEDTLHPDRIVIGSDSEKAQKLLLELHAPISGERLICDMRSAQLVKYASNALLATKISFANSIANICERSGADVEKVLKGVGLDKRLGRSFLYPGIGYGGSCLPKDVLAFISIGRQFDYEFNLLKEVDSVNERQIDITVNKIRKALNAEEAKGRNLQGKKLAVLGLAFKPNTDDIRDAPAIKIINQLLSLGAKVTAYDPKAMDNAKRVIKNISFAKNITEALKGKDALLLLTEWPEFIDLDLNYAKKLLKSPIIIDGRNMIDKEKALSHGFRYIGMGR